MASTTSKVLTGCGIGCLLVIFMGVGVSFMGYRWIKNTSEAYEEAGRIERELKDQFGQARAFVPVPGPGVPSDRMEVFLAVRENLTEPRDGLSATVTGLAGGDGEPGVGSGFRAARAGISLGPRVLEFTNARNRALLDAGMGIGEYTWIYWITYFAWLGHPADDSALHEMLENHNSGDASVQIHIDAGMEPERITWRLRRDITAMLRNLQAELESDPAQAEQLAAVMAEMAELGADPGRVPWQSGLPEVFAVALGPYRERLEATYSKAANPFELVELE
jgi:hypothetical protein